MTFLATRVAAILVAATCALGVAAEAGQSPPEIPADTLITLERVAGDGGSPGYSVSIDALGRVEYEGKAFVRVEGRQTDRIPRAAVVELLATVANIGFFDLENAYKFKRLPDGREQYTTDRRQSFVSVRVNGRSKRIEDYDGTPEPLIAFEARIDAITRSKRWTFLDEPMLASLRAEGWSPSNEELARLLERAVWRDDLPIVQGLLDFGADPNRAAENMGPPFWSVQSAPVLRALLAAGGDAFTKTGAGRSLLHIGSYLEPEATALLLRAGLSADEVDLQTGDTALMSAVRTGNVQVVAMLLAAGASAAVRDGDGRSALELARVIQQSETRPPDPGLRYRQNYPEVVALLQRALAKR